MAIDPQIPLEVKSQPLFNPLQSIAALMQLRGQTAELATRQAQAEEQRARAEELRAQAEQRNRDLSDANTVQAAQGNPEYAGLLGKGDVSFLAGKVQPKTLDALQKSIIAAQREHATFDEEKLTRFQNHSKIVTQALDGLMSLPTDADRAAAYPGVIGNLKAQGVLEGVDNVPEAISGKPEELKAFAARNNLFAGLNEAAIAHRKEQLGVKNIESEIATRDTAGADTHLRQVAELPKIKAESEEETRKLEMMKGSTPQQWHAQVDSAINPKDHGPLNARTKALVDSALALGDFKAAQAAIKDGADQIGRTETAVASAKATAPIKINVAGAEAEARARAATPTSEGLDMMAEAALSGQAPSSRNPIIVKQIWDRAAEIAKSRGQTAVQALAAANAAKASRGALDAVTKQYETLKPFAEMAEKNANVLEAQIAKVSDLGAPFLNTPIRALESKFAGNTNVAAFHAAILPVQADFARILNSPTGAGVLSDTARSEMEGALGTGATTGQIKAALDIFRADANNRKSAYEAQLKDLRGASVAGGGSPSQYKAGDTRVINGVTYQRDDNGNWHPK